MTLAGELTTIYSFCQGALPNCTDGFDVSAGLAQASDGSFYGTTVEGGTHGGCVPFTTCGTVLRITPNGELTTVHNFMGSDGAATLAGVVQATSGVFYGTPTAGGIENSYCDGGCGTMFSLSANLRPFVALLSTAGPVGATVEIVGHNLSGATGVDFNGTPAVFTVLSSTLISATVPTGASTGFVTVATPGLQLNSNARFQVRP